MASQLTIRINAEERTAVVSRPGITPSRAIAAAAAAGSQVLALTAYAGHGSGSGVVEAGGGETTNPIFYPESLFVAFVAGVIVGMVAVGAGAKLVRRMG